LDIGTDERIIGIPPGMVVIGMLGCIGIVPRIWAGAGVAQTSQISAAATGGPRMRKHVLTDMTLSEKQNRAISGRTG
jgi:hypothetical protein